MDKSHMKLSTTQKKERSRKLKELVIKMSNATSLGENDYLY